MPQRPRDRAPAGVVRVYAEYPACKAAKPGLWSHCSVPRAPRPISGVLISSSRLSSMLLATTFVLPFTAFTCFSVAESHVLAVWEAVHPQCFASVPK